MLATAHQDRRIPAVVSGQEMETRHTEQDEDLAVVKDKRKKTG